MASRRRISYDLVLRVRKRQEEVRAQALAAAVTNQHQAEARRENVATRQRALLDEAGQALEGAVDLRRVASIMAYERRLSRESVELDAQVRRLKRVVREKMAELDSAMRNRKIAEKLVEYVDSRETEVERVHSRKSLDDMVAQRAAFHRRRLTLP